MCVFSGVPKLFHVIRLLIQLSQAPNISQFSTCPYFYFQTNRQLKPSNNPARICSIRYLKKTKEVDIGACSLPSSN